VLSLHLRSYTVEITVPLACKARSDWPGWCLTLGSALGHDPLGSGWFRVVATELGCGRALVISRELVAARWRGTARSGRMETV
jgi:hypothetical protein